MELDWLEDFLALIDSGNFSRAAEARNLTQPAFGRRIRALEDWAGAPLFDRSTHRISLTHAGDRFRPFAEDIVRRVLQGREEVRHAANVSAATLKFAATHVLSWTFFPRWLSQLEGRMRVGPVQLISDTMRGCEAVMRQGQAQYLICHYHSSVPDYLAAEQFRSIRVGDDLLVPLCAPDQRGGPRGPVARPLRARRQVRPRDRGTVERDGRRARGRSSLGSHGEGAPRAHDCAAARHELTTDHHNP